MKLKDLTLHNVSQYIEGYTRWLWEGFYKLPKHTKEQILWRASKCPPECSKTSMCQNCSCDFPQKLYVTKSCNYQANLPDLMNEEDWKVYKAKLIENDKNNKIP